MNSADLRKRAADARIAGLSLAIVRGGAIETLQTEGFADAATSRAVQTTTVFEAASLGKPVFAYAVLKLADSGAIGLDDPILRFAPDYVEADDRTARITARHVLSHTCGLPNWRSQRRPLKCHFEPGARFSYSGEGYVFLQRALETILGEPLDAFARRLVFEPLGMTRSSYDQRGLPDGALALPHDDAGAPQIKAVLPPNPAGALHTTARDYALFLKAVVAGEGLSEATARAWLEPVRRTPAPFWPALDPVGEPEFSPDIAWGLGWGVEIDRGTFFHWGSNPGFKAFTMGSTRTGCAFVVLANGGAELAIGPALAADLLPGPYPCLRWFGV